MEVQRVKGKKYSKVAYSDGSGYSLLRPEDQKWRHYKNESPEAYKVSPKYSPQHLKTLRLGCRLLISEHWADFKNQKTLTDEG